MENYTPGIGVVAGSLMLKWDLMDAHILKHDIHLQAGDDINVFINFESVIRNLSMQKGINGILPCLLQTAEMQSTDVLLLYIFG